MNLEDAQYIAGWLHAIKDDEMNYDDLVKRCKEQITKSGYEFKDENKFISDLLDKYKENEVDHFTDMGYSVEEYFEEELNIMKNPKPEWWVDLCEKFLTK